MPVPEAPVHEDAGAILRQDDVRGPRQHAAHADFDGGSTPVTPPGFAAHSNRITDAPSAPAILICGVYAVYCSNLSMSGIIPSSAGSH